MLKCEICGCEFNALIEKHYISRRVFIGKTKTAGGYHWEYVLNG